MSKKSQLRLDGVEDQVELKKFARKNYRDGYMQTQVRAGIAYQFQALRKKFDLTQIEMAERVGKPQSTVSRLESVEYGRVSVQTLLDIASGLDVALLVQFVSYPDFISRTDDMTESALQVDTVFESLEAARPEAQQAPAAQRTSSAPMRRYIAPATGHSAILSRGHQIQPLPPQSAAIGTRAYSGGIIQ